MRSNVPKKGPPPADFDENPIWTDEDFRRARPAAEVMGPAFMAKVARAPGRPKVEEPAEAVSIRLKPRVLRHLRSRGRGWQTEVNAVLERAIAAGEI